VEDAALQTGREEWVAREIFADFFPMRILGRWDESDGLVGRFQNHRIGHRDISRPLFVSLDFS
jgi:hypothetical protein